MIDEGLFSKDSTLFPTLSCALGTAFTLIHAINNDRDVVIVEADSECAGKRLNVSSSTSVYANATGGQQDATVDPQSAGTAATESKSSGFSS